MPEEVRKAAIEAMRQASILQTRLLIAVEFPRLHRSRDNEIIGGQMLALAQAVSSLRQLTEQAP